MKKSTLTLFSILGIVVLFFGMGCSTYNGLVNYDEEVDKSWNNVETQYQRRSDLILNLAKTVMKAADTEKEILQGVIEARSAASSIKLDASNLTKENLTKFDVAQSKLKSRFNLLVERYPQLKSIPQFAKLSDEIAGTENRISTARSDFNEVIANYNKRVRKFPNVIFAGMFGFERKSGFSSEEGAEKALDMDDVFGE
jgi:LemA protein